MVLSVRTCLVCVSIVLWSLSSGCQNDPPVELGTYAYEQTTSVDDCPPGTREGPAGITDGERSAKGIAYNVRTPANYDATVAHSLLMVYAPAGINQFRNEGFTGLTKEATQAGFIDAIELQRFIIAMEPCCFHRIIS